ncbi:MAG: NAD(P)-dependent dehydrogenase (short-subunit alcohol dehydrogenase family) [Candidatus Aldehydirespiratoraceae bacterium]|jgi:NAD(P)-dependent dehydrogenase (short-subunit alcohol dehydrogenase family)
MDIDRLTSLFGLEGRRAVVTGGSRGVGRMIAEGLLDAGCEVIITARKVEQVTQAADEMSAKGTVIAVPSDLSTDKGIEHLANAVAERWDSLDILINNAGASWGEEIESYPTSGWDKVMNVNVKGVFFLTQKLLPLLRAAASPEHPARVINTGSVNGLTPPDSNAFAYSSSKAAVHMLTKHLAKELAPDHITVNAIAPGPFDSAMMAFVLDDPSSRESMARGVPLGRVGKPDDMAGVAIYLASAAASYVTGAIVPVGGGLSTIAK